MLHFLFAQRRFSPFYFLLAMDLAMRLYCHQTHLLNYELQLIWIFGLLADVNSLACIFPSAVYLEGVQSDCPQ